MPKVRLSTTRRSLIVVAGALVLIGLHAVGWLAPLEHIVVGSLAPLQQRVFSLGSWVNGLYSQVGRSGVETQLQNELTRLTIENSQLRSLLADYRELDSQIDFLDASGLRGVTARVIGRNPEPDVQLLILNRGTFAGVRVGLPVITSTGVLVGIVREVRGGSASVLLLTDSQSKLAAAVQAEQAISGVIEGEHGLSLRMELIPQGAAVSAGQTVVTSGSETGIPSGLVIGQIDRLERAENAFFQTAYVQPLVDYGSLSLVSIIVTEPIDE